MNNVCPAALTVLLISTSVLAQPEETALNRAAPALAAYNINVVENQLWRRSGLSPRDRSIVTVAALVASGKTELQAKEFARSLDNGMTPTELSGVITHLAFYSGWSNGIGAAKTAAALYEQRGIKASSLPGPEATLLPLDRAVESSREKTVQERYGKTSQGVVDFTRDTMFLNLWQRSDLTPRDRSLITVSSLVANGQIGQVPFHLNRAMDNGLTKAEASEALTQLAFYANWPNVYAAMPVIQKVFDSRSQ